MCVLGLRWSGTAIILKVGCRWWCCCEMLVGKVLPGLWFPNTSSSQSTRDCAVQLRELDSPESTVMDVKSHRCCKLHGKGFIFPLCSNSTLIKLANHLPGVHRQPGILRPQGCCLLLLSPPGLHLFECITGDAFSFLVPSPQKYEHPAWKFSSQTDVPYYSPAAEPVTGAEAAAELVAALNLLLRSGPPTSTTIFPQACTAVALHYIKRVAAAWSCLRWMVISCWVSALRAAPHPYSSSVGTR